MHGKSHQPDDPSVESFEELFERSFHDIWRFIRRRVESKVDADDVASEVFAIAWRRRSELPPGDERRLWLFGVARNAIRNHHRSTLRQRRVSAQLVRMSGPDDAGRVELGERDDDLWVALSRLTDAERDLLLMRAWDCLSVGEIALLLGCTPNAVSVRLSKARARLRRNLERKDPQAAGHEVVDFGTERRRND